MPRGPTHAALGAHPRRRASLDVSTRHPLGRVLLSPGTLDPDRTAQCRRPRMLTRDRPRPIDICPQPRSPMSPRIQKLTIRLLKPKVRPVHTLRQGLDLYPFEPLSEAQIAFGTIGSDAPKWAHFLELSDAQTLQLKSSLPCCVLFVPADGRWFAVTFGLAHVKLDSTKFEERFGLRVVLNSVDPEQIRSTDIRTPDENTMSRRSQASRGSRQEAFSIDIERDIIQGLAGSPKDPGFASRVAGSNSLSMDKKMDLRMLPDTCSAAYRMSQRSDYRKAFGWIDHIQNVRSKSLILKLDKKLVHNLDRALKGHDVGHLGMACPVIYNPMNTKFIRYRGFRSTARQPDLEIHGYLGAMRQAGLTTYTFDQLRSHTVNEVDDSGSSAGERWRVADCLSFEAKHGGNIYVLSAGLWYKIDKSLASSIETFFKSIKRFSMPRARRSDNEVIYNERLEKTNKELLCLDRSLIKPTDATSPIEVCDFLTKDGDLIHVKDRTSSSTLSHLFNQGTVSGTVLSADPPARDEFRQKIQAAQKKAGLAGFDVAIPPATATFDPSRFTVVYAVLGTQRSARLPFFSLVTLRQAVKDLRARGYQCAFAWVQKK